MHLRPPADNKACTPTLKPPCWYDVGDLRIRATATSTTGATVTVCRKIAGGKETRDTCAKRIDADCNGMVNTTDPECVKIMKRDAPRPAMQAVPLPLRL